MGQQQSITQLEQRKKKLEDEIKFTKKKITQIRSKKKNSLSELETLKSQIRAREELITTARAQLNEVEKKISRSQLTIAALEGDIEKLKEQYSKMIYNAYVHHSSRSNLLFVFSSSSFNEAFRRVQYVKAYSAFRKEQAKLIEASQESLQWEVRRLEEARAQKSDLLTMEMRNRSELNSEKNQVSSQLSSFSSEEKKYLAQVREKERAAKELNTQIDKLIAAAIAKANAAESASTASSSKSFALTREAKELSNQFAANKGKLPWPVERGTITGRFGKRKHPVLKTEVENNGIDISTNKNAAVRSVFNGEVMNIFHSPVFKWGVLISHGNYFTVYTGLEQVSVAEKQKIKTKQAIGSAYTNEESGLTEVHLEMWQGRAKMNPESWLYR